MKQWHGAVLHQGSLAVGGFLDGAVVLGLGLALIWYTETDVSPGGLVWMGGIGGIGWLMVVIPKCVVMW
jgi:hypothetical protein